MEEYSISNTSHLHDGSHRDCGFFGRQSRSDLSLRRPPLSAKTTDAPRRTYLERGDGRRRRGGDAADEGGGGEEGGGHRARGRVRGRTPGGQRVRRARPNPVSRSRARVSSRADPPTIAQPRGRGDHRSPGVEAHGSRVARATRTTRLVFRAVRPSPGASASAARAARRPRSDISRKSD